MVGRAAGGIVHVPTGKLYVHQRSGDTSPVLAIHGISSTHRLWHWLHDASPETWFIEPDLAGRGSSPRSAASRSSVSVHAGHLRELLDELELERVDVIGMSMGGFVAVELAARFPERVRSLTLVDGGPPIPREAGEQPREQALSRAQDAYGDSTSWPTLDAYVDHYHRRAAPLVDPSDGRLAEMLAHDLDRGVEGGRVRRDLPTVLDDAVSLWASGRPAQAWCSVTAPVHFLHAEWWAGRDSPPMYPPGHVSEVFAGPGPGREAEVELVRGVDHASIIMTHEGARRCATALASAQR